MYRCVGVIDTEVNLPDFVLMDEDTLRFMPFKGKSVTQLIRSGQLRNLTWDGGKFKCSDVAFTKLPKYSSQGKYMGTRRIYMILCGLIPNKSYLLLDNNLNINCASEQTLITMLCKDKDCCCNVKIGSDALGDAKIVPLGGLTIPSISRQSGPEKVGMGLRGLARRYMI